MLCSEFEERFHTLLDDRCDPNDDSVISGHASQCAQCRNNLNSWDLLSVGLETWEPPRSTASIDNIVAMALASPANESADVTPTDKPKTRPFDLASVIVPVLLSAVVLAIALFVPMFMAKNGSEPIAQNNQNEPAKPAIVNESPIVIAQNTDRQPSEADVVRGRELLNEMRARLPEPAALGTIANDLTAQELPNGLQPIAGSFEVALNAFRKTLPGKKGLIIPGKPQASKLATPSFA